MEAASGVVPAADALRPFRPALAFGFFNALNWQVAIGTPMVLLVEALGGSTFHVGLCFAFVYLMTPVQVLSTSLLPRYGFKRMMMSGWGLRALFLLPCIALAWLSRDGRAAPWMLYGVVGSVFFFTLFRTIGSCAWLPWLYKLIPEPLRGKYFATEQLTTGVASIGILLIGAVLFKVLPLHEAFIAEYAIAFVGAGLSYLSLQRMADTEKPTIIGLDRVVRETPGICFRPGALRAFLWVSCLFGFATTAIAPFGIYFLRVESHIAPGDILLFTTLQYTGVVLMSLLLRNEIDRLGARPFFFTTGLTYAAVAVFWLALLAFRFEAASYFPLVYLALGMGSAMWAAAFPKFLPVVLPTENRPLVLAVYGAATAFASGLAPLVWGVLLQRTGPPPGMNRLAFSAFFVFVLVGMTGMVLAMRRFRYPIGPVERIELGDLVLRPHRAFSYLVTLVDESITPGDGATKGGPPEA